MGGGESSGSYDMVLASAVIEGERTRPGPGDIFC